MTNERSLKAVAFGEVLWDVFSDQKKIGGAPLNVALRMKSLGAEVTMISSVGNDQDGQEIINWVKNSGLDTDTIMQSKDFPTGLVKVILDKQGSASYEIAYPSAWDKIVLDDKARDSVAAADVLIYGSLVGRDEISRNALVELLAMDVYKVFDVNLRKPHYSYEILEQFMKPADCIKFNDDEIIEIAAALQSPFKSLEENMQFIAEKTNAASICVTKGKDGALLLWKGKVYNNAGYPVEVADTVGAGDSFLASLITLLLTGKAPQEALDYACAIGALVAQSHGANPQIASSEIEKMMLR